MGVRTEMMPRNEPKNGMKRFDPTATPARSCSLTWPDMTVSKKPVAVRAICVTKIGSRTEKKRFAFAR